MSRQSDRLKCFAGGLIKFYERLPCHDEPIIRLVLPVDTTNIWPLGVDPALFLYFVEIHAGAISTIQAGRFRE